MKIGCYFRFKQPIFTWADASLGEHLQEPLQKGHSEAAIKVNKVKESPRARP